MDAEWLVHNDQPVQLIVDMMFMVQRHHLNMRGDEVHSSHNCVWVYVLSVSLSVCYTCVLFVLMCNCLCCIALEASICQRQASVESIGVVQDVRGGPWLMQDKSISDNDKFWALHWATLIQAYS